MMKNKLQIEIYNYKISVESMPNGKFLRYYISVEDIRENKYYHNEEIGKLFRFDYGRLVLDSGGYMEVSEKDLDGNDIEEYWFEYMGDVLKVNDKIEEIILNKLR